MSSPPGRWEEKSQKQASWFFTVDAGVDACTSQQKKCSRPFSEELESRALR
jgi:hypothetical protein